MVVSPTPWVQVCDREGRFRLDGVPDGRYILTAWHEMGDPVASEITVAGEQEVRSAGAGSDRTSSCRHRHRAIVRSIERAPVRPWADVIDRIGVTLAASRDAATRPGELTRARRLAEDAYWVEFESSDMETAVTSTWALAGPASSSEQFHAISVGGSRRGREAASPRRHGRALPARCFSTCGGRDASSTPRE